MTTEKPDPSISLNKGSSLNSLRPIKSEKVLILDKVLRVSP